MLHGENNSMASLFNMEASQYQQSNFYINIKCTGWNHLWYDSPCFKNGCLQRARIPVGWNKLELSELLILFISYDRCWFDFDF